MNAKKRKYGSNIGDDVWIPEDIFFCLMEFIDNETLWITFPLVCKGFYELLKTKKKILKRDCYECKEEYADLINGEREMIEWIKKNPDKIFNQKKSTQEHIREHNESIAELEKQYDYRIVDGLQKVYDYNDNNYKFMCHKCIEKCGECNGWFRPIYTGDYCHKCHKMCCGNCIELCERCDKITCLSCSDRKSYEREGLCVGCYKEWQKELNVE